MELNFSIVDDISIIFVKIILSNESIKLLKMMKGISMFDNNKYADLIIENRIDEAKAYVASTIPDYLIKFYSLNDDDDKKNNKKIETLRRNSNWFYTSSEQNDPFDMRMFYVDKLEKYNVQKKYCDKAEQMVSQMRDAFLLCSFTGNGIDDLSMWANYSNNHKGYCVKYKVNRKEYVNRIFYYDKPQDTTDIQLHTVDALVGMINGEQNTDEVDKYKYVNMMLLSIKHKSWEHENEFRLLYPDHENISGCNVKNSRFGIEPTDIYVGINCEENYEFQLLKVSELLNCPCWKMKTDSKKIVDFERKIP